MSPLSQKAPENRGRGRVLNPLSLTASHSLPPFFFHSLSLPPSLALPLPRARALSLSDLKKDALIHVADDVELYPIP